MCDSGMVCQRETGQATDETKQCKTSRNNDVRLTYECYVCVVCPYRCLSMLLLLALLDVKLNIRRCGANWTLFILQQGLRGSNEQML